MTIANQQEKGSSIEKWVQFKYKQFREGGIQMVGRCLKVCAKFVIIDKTQVKTITKTLDLLQLQN